MGLVFATAPGEALESKAANVKMDRQWVALGTRWVSSAANHGASSASSDPAPGVTSFEWAIGQRLAQQVSLRCITQSDLRAPAW